jgi:NADH:ubiquinone oxidoreductase subunit
MRSHELFAVQLRGSADVGIFAEIFSWWGGNTWSNRIYTALRGTHVGTDAEGNRYYVQSRGVGPLDVPRRWVIFKDLAEASKIPPEWHGWMHYTVDTPPTEEKYSARPWQKPHVENLTGTPAAWRPPGSILGSGQRAGATGDYKAWKPE